MIICGVDITNSEIIFAAVQMNDDESILPVKECTAKMNIDIDDEQNSVTSFFTKLKYLKDSIGIEYFVIIKRIGRGVASADGITFKVETLFQMLNCGVILVHPRTIESRLKKIKCDQLELLKQEYNKYQGKALNAAFQFLMQKCR